MSTKSNPPEFSTDETAFPDKSSNPQRLPSWLKVSARFSPNYHRIKEILAENKLHSVCQEASCPNIRECFGEGTATFLLMGPHCTRGCGFCNVATGRPSGLDYEEPARLASVVSELKLKQVVITSVTRDDLPDGGAFIFANTIELLRKQDNKVRIEILVPDMRGEVEPIQTMLASGPDVFAHNVETIRRLYPRVRPGADLNRSLKVLRIADRYAPRPVVKTGFMVGLGENFDEIRELFGQIYDCGTQIVTVGQYLRPSRNHLPVEKFYHPDEFLEIAVMGKNIGFQHVETGPMVRSSYRAFHQSKDILGGQE